jgi:hypothetical protein
MPCHGCSYPLCPVTKPPGTPPLTILPPELAELRALCEARQQESIRSVMEVPEKYSHTSV